MKKRIILVPWDFTPQCETALQHAYQLAQVMGDNILLFHIKKLPRFASKSTRVKAEEELRELRIKLQRESVHREAKLDADREKLEADLREKGQTHVSIHDADLTTMVVAASNFDRAISEVYNQLGVNLIVSGRTYTEGGKEYDLFKILKKAKSEPGEPLPFMIVDRPPKHRYYTEIVVPMDYDRKYKQALRWVAFLSHSYKCNVDLIKPALQDESLKREMQNNIYFTKKILDAQSVIYGIKTAHREKGFYSEVQTFINEIGADMVILMTNNIKALFGREDVSFDVPIMYINPLSQKLQGFA